MLRVHAPGDAEATEPGRGRRGGPARGRATVAPLTFRAEPVPDRVLGHRGPGRVVHAGLRGLRRGRRRRPGRLPAGETVLTPYVFATERPRRLTAEERAALERFLEPRPARARRAPRHRRRRARHFPVQVRFSDVDVYGHVNNVKYFEYFQEARIRDVHGAGRGRRRAAAARARSSSRRPTSTTARRSCSGPSPTTCGRWVAHVGTDVRAPSSRRSRDGDRRSPAARVVLRPEPPAAGARPPRADRPQDRVGPATPGVEARHDPARTWDGLRPRRRRTPAAMSSRLPVVLDTHRSETTAVAPCGGFSGQAGWSNGIPSTRRTNGFDSHRQRTLGRLP